jgi:hypothetical protein
MKTLEEVLRTSRIVSGGFLGKDPRILEEILEADAAELNGLGTTREAVAARMKEITDRALEGLGTRVRFDEKREVSADDNRGQIICPWPHAGRYFKTITTVRRADTGETLRWSELSRHFIEEHGFFQGRGSAFRLEPRTLVRVIFD